MSATAGAADGQGAGERLGLKPDMVVQELGWDDDVDDDLRTAIEETIGGEMVGGEHGDVVDTVVLWWRDGDGDLVDALVDALTDLADDGSVWLLTPKFGRASYVDAAAVHEAAPVAGLATTTSQPVSRDWAATRLVPPRGGRRR